MIDRPYCLVRYLFESILFILVSIGFGIFVMISVTPICLAAGAIMMYVYNSFYLHCDTRSVETLK
jgi:hypothetical protein